MNKSLVFLEKTIAVATIFLLPTQIALHLWPSYAFIFGIRVDYLSVAISLTNILLVTLLSFWVLNDWKSIFVFYKDKHLYVWAFFLFALFNISFSSLPPASFYEWIKIFEAVILGVYFRQRELLKKPVIFKTLFYSLLFFSLIGIAQFLLGHTTGLFYFLGERSFSLTTPGIALVSIGGRSFLRAYSTFPHPNAFAGFLGASLLWINTSLRQRKNIWFYTGVGIVSFAFLLTFSLTAFLAMATVIAFYFISKKETVFNKAVKTFFNIVVVASILLPLFSSGILKRANLQENLFQRVDLSYLSGQMIAEKFLTGEGVNTFIFNTPRFKGLLNYNWFLQPVHNIFLLVFAETGIAGILIFYLSAYKVLKIFLGRRRVGTVLTFVFIVLTGLTDHYWLTIEQNLLFLSLFLGTSLRNSE